MLAKLINENEENKVEIAWHNSHGIRENKTIPIAVSEENEEREVELSDAFHPLLASYTEYVKSLLVYDGEGSKCILQPDEVELLLSTLRQNAAFVPVFLACFFGLSMREVLNLQWYDVDLHHNVLTIKSGMTMRMIRLCPRARDLFVTVAAWQKTQYRLAGSDGPVPYYFICLDESGAFFDDDDLAHRLQTALQKLGFSPVSFDELRFSSAMMLHQNGYTLPELWSFLGERNCYFNVLSLSNCQWVEQG